jgi:coenzyme F420-reducing hydrogenase gamma subunit
MISKRVQWSDSRKPRIAVFKFASCDGCQLSILDAEEQLFDILGSFAIVYFPEASSRMLKGPYDIGLVEGSITTHHDAEMIHDIRKQCGVLITIGACATAGGVQALRNWHDVNEFVRTVYARPDYIRTLKMSTPVAEHVPVDLELRGCPINKEHLIEVLSATLAGRKPNIPTYAVCMECKRKGQVCVAVAEGKACLGPVTAAGCGALCPGIGRGCYGCFGPTESCNTNAMVQILKDQGRDGAEIRRLFHTYNAWSWQFRDAGERQEVHQ